MADISNEDLRKEIAAILKDADLTSLSSKKVRQQLEEKLDTDLTDRKKEVDDLVMECLHNKQDGKGKPNKKSKDDEDDDEDKEEDEEEEDEEEEEEKPKAKRAKKPAKRPKKGSSDESEEGSDDDASDEEYSPSKKGKSAPKKGKPARKKKGSDSDSDEDWAKSRKSSSGGGGGAKRGGGGGGKRGGGGYTRPQTLSPELAALMGQESMPRHEVVRKIWSIIKERNLYDPKNKQFAICDNEMLKIFGVKRFRTFGMMKYLKNHFIE